MNIVDVPGFGDSENGPQFDVEVLANIRNLFKSRKYIPNFILLTVNISDARLAGQFKKLLRAMNNLFKDVVLDKENVNLIVVLTHLMAAIPKIQKNPAEKVTLVKSLISENLFMRNVGVELAENRYQDYELPKVGDYYKLSNQVLFPRNIYQSMIAISKHIDPVGHNIVNDLYRHLSTTDYEITKTIIPIVPQDIFNEITQTEQVTYSELGNSLHSSWNDLTPIEKSECRLEPASFNQQLQILGYRKISDLPRSPKDLMFFFQQLCPDEGMIILLRKSFGLEPKSFLCDLLVGKAYDITTDKMKTFQLLECGRTALAPIGCILPKCIVAHKYIELNFTCKMFRNNSDMIKERMNKLKINVALDRVGVGFNFPIRNGYNVADHRSHQSLTAVIEYKLIKLEIRHDAPINQEILRAVEDLPTNYEEENVANVNKWKEFFDCYGTHYITSAFIGGLVEFNVSIDAEIKAQNSSFDVSVGLSGFLSTIFPSCEASLSRPTDFTKSIDRKSLNIVVHGGSSSLASQLTNSKSQDEFLQNLAAWQESLHENPVVSDYSITLDEVATIVKRIKPQLTLGMQTAVDDLYQSRLISEAMLPLPTRECDSIENTVNNDGGCLDGNTLIQLPGVNKFASVSSLKRGDFVLDQHGKAVRVIGVSKIYTTRSTLLYGFHNDSSDYETTVPFFNSSHTFLSHHGNLIVVSKNDLENLHPQMKTEFTVEQMPYNNIPVLRAAKNDLQSVATFVTKLCSSIIQPGHELYFLIVAGDGTYRANGFVCYHELPKFEKWPETFAMIYRTIMLLPPNGLHNFNTFDYNAYTNYLRIVMRIKCMWQLTIKRCLKQEKYVIQPAINSDYGDEYYYWKNIDDFSNLVNEMVSNCHYACFGFMLYTHCGEMLHKFHRLKQIDCHTENVLLAQAEQVMVQNVFGI